MNRADALALATAAKQEQSARRRKAALRYHHAGRQPKLIAVLLGISPDTVRRYIREAKGGHP